MKKKLYALTAIIMCAVMMTACGTKDEIAADELAERLNNDVKYSEQLTALSQEAAAKYLYLNPGDYDEIKAYISTEAVADEFIIVKTKSVSSVRDKLTAHAEALKTKYKEYRPDEVAKLDSAVIETLGDTVTLIVAPDKESAETVYNNYLKK